MLIQQIAKLVAPWHALYGESKIVPAITESVHITALLFGGGLAIAADRSTLRVAKGDTSMRVVHLKELHSVHRPVLIALTFSFLSGVALAAADVETFASAPMFWVKLSLVALLLVNGAVLTATESRLRALGPGSDRGADDGAALWARLRFNALCSVALWTTTLIAGVTLTNVS
jgi:hypothetical protein